MSGNGAYLLAACERIERLQEEKRTIQDDIKEIYADVADRGFDKKALRAVVKRRGQEPDERTEFETIVQLYEQEISNASREHTRDTRELPSGAEAGSAVRAGAPIREDA
jgi:uncharacterized protein (UPF0335 family)